jgi:hypothetical protein
MRKHSAGTVRLQVEALEDRSLLSVAAPVVPLSSSPTAAEAEDRSQTPTGTQIQRQSIIPRQPEATSTQTQVQQRSVSSGTDDRGETSAGTSTAPATNDDASERGSGGWGTSSGDDHHPPPPTPPPTTNPGNPGTTGGGQGTSGAPAPGGSSGSTGTTGGTQGTGGASAPGGSPVAALPGSPVSSPAPSDLSASVPAGSTDATPSDLHGAAALQTLPVADAQPAERVLVDTETESAMPVWSVATTEAATPAAGDPRPAPLPTTVASGEQPMPANPGGAPDRAAADLLNSAAKPNESPATEAAPLEGEDAGTPAPRQAGLLADVLPVDAAQLQEGIRRFLGQMEQVGAVLTTSPSGMTLYCWLLAASAAAAAGLIVRSQAKRRSPHSAGDPLFPWTPEADGSPAEGPL